jgi:hypothetical protein
MYKMYLSISSLIIYKHHNEKQIRLEIKYKEYDYNNVTLPIDYRCLYKSSTSTFTLNKNKLRYSWFWDWGYECQTTTFNYISYILSVLLMDESKVPEENIRPVASHRLILSLRFV